MLFLSLKEIEGETFDDAMKAMAELLSAECQRISASLDTEKSVSSIENVLMAGLLLNGEYDVRSNYEMGGGRSDIAIVDQRGSRAVIIETKHSKNYDDLAKDSEAALEQIQSREYAWPFLRKEFQVIAYGISFVGKECCVKVKQ